MSVPKGRRKPSKFEAPHQFFKLRAAVTDLMLLDFGFSEEKYRKKIEHYRQSHASAHNVDEVVARYEKKCESFNRWFIDQECDAILKLIRDIGREFTIANSIYPSETPARESEIIERRIHMDLAIAQCYALKQEINYVIGALPVDINKYERFDELINYQIALFKGVRNSDRRFLRDLPASSANKEDHSQKSTNTEATLIVQSTLHKENSAMNQTSDVDTPIDISKIPTYQQVKTNQNESNQQRVPNTSKMNTSSFPQQKTAIGVLQPVLPGQSPPRNL